MKEIKQSKECISLIDTLCNKHKLSTFEYEYLLDNANDEIVSYAREKSVEFRKNVYGNDVYVRALIEISNYCKNDCLYCGIRKSNINCDRYRLNESQILSCCEEGYNLGFKTFVLQGGEDCYFNDEVICNIISKIKKTFPDTAITLSLGERSYESYNRLYNAGADRYLLRHETANQAHYKKLHTNKQSYTKRIECLRDLKKIGYQVGCGFMVGSPYQTNSNIANDLKFIEQFKPDMCGIGPFIPHKDTPFSTYKQGSVEKTTFLISLIRIIQPNILLPATTALGTASEVGRERGILAGANVIMPNLSPLEDRKKYELYDNKLFSGTEAGENLELLKTSIRNIGYKIVSDKGDIIK